MFDNLVAPMKPNKLMHYSAIPIRHSEAVARFDLAVILSPSTVLSDKIRLVRLITARIP